MTKFIKTFKNITAAALLLMMCAFLAAPVKAAQYSRINFDCYAVVIGVIDSNTIKVSVLDTNETGFVRLIGLNPGGDAAFRYLYDALIGVNVQLQVDKNVKPDSGMWNVLHVLKDGADMSEKMLSLGYGTVNVSDNKASNYAKLVASQKSASDAGSGVWNAPGEEALASPADFTPPVVDKININTATPALINSFLDGVPLTVANNIKSYRDRNPISDVRELKFVTGFTSAMYDANKDKINVITNMKTATQTELLSLVRFTATDAARVIQFRENYDFKDLYDLATNRVLSTATYSANMAYMTISDTAVLDARIPADVVYDVNSATQAQLASLFSNPTAQYANGLASAIVNNRTNGAAQYTYKTIYELAALRVQGAYVGEDYMNGYEDNLTVPAYGDYLNLNTATFLQLRNLGIEYQDAEKIYALRGRISSWASMPAGVDISAFNDKITLYTNINLAGENELSSLNPGMTADLVSGIIAYRNDQPFGNIQEIRDFFVANNALSVFNAIGGYIVVR